MRGHNFTVDMRIKNLQEKICELNKVIGICIRFSWDASKRYTVLRMIAVLVKAGVAVSLALISKEMLNILSNSTNKAGATINFLRLSLLMLLVIVINSVLKEEAKYWQTVHEALMEKKLSIFLMSKSLSADLSFFDDSDSQDLFQFATQNSTALAETVWQIISGLGSICSFFTAFLLLIDANWLYGIVPLLAAIPTTIVSSKFTQELHHLREIQVNDARKTSYLQALASAKNYAPLLRLYNAEDELIHRYEMAWKRLFLKRISKERQQCKRMAVLNIFPEITIILIGVYVARKVLNLELTIGDYSLYTGLVSQLWTNTQILIESIMQIYSSKLKVESIQKLANMQSLIPNNGIDELQHVIKIEFSHVGFFYPGTNREVLSDVSFQIVQGEKVALVGINGAGKTTILHLLLRYYEPTSGEIKINGKRIQEYSLTSLRDAFSVYLQNEPNFAFSLRENMNISDLGMDEDKKEPAMRKVLDDVDPTLIKRVDGDINRSIMRLLAADGIELSSGQHQKIAIARALYRRHSVLVLDEPSSSLDPEAEDGVFKVFKNYARDDNIIIFTSHRLSNVTLADRILVIEEGRIIEDGTRTELLSTNSRYAQLFHYQSDKYREEA